MDKQEDLMQLIQLLVMSKRAMMRIPQTQKELATMLPDPGELDPSDRDQLAQAHVNLAMALETNVEVAEDYLATCKAVRDHCANTLPPVPKL